ncbi:hypothetical protein B0H13DRAFT_1881714 [Mycena leptocephala]|nr:hypothetical protein B0H13DRAFT_1881714 [Mycena leptocephala]
MIDNCYSRQAQIHHSRQFKQHTCTLWATVNNPVANWWLLRTSLPIPTPTLHAPRKPAATAKASKVKHMLAKLKGKEKAADPPFPAAIMYELVHSVTMSKTLNFPMCGELGGHLLAADYCDTGVCSLPDKYTMAQMICKINAGMVVGLQSLDYFYESSVLDYVKQHSFMELYDYLDAVLTADEKHPLNWGPICLKHLLCKYLHFITDL